MGMLVEVYNSEYGDWDISWMVADEERYGGGGGERWWWM